MRRLANPFWLLVGTRVAFLVLVAASVLWAPTRGTAQIAADRAYGSLGDLLFGVLDKWDAAWFLRIARHGYDAPSAAFFPLYPLLVRGVGTVIGSYLVAGVAIALVSAGVAAWALAQLARPLLGEDGARDVVLYVALFPTAFVFTSVYSDGPFLAAAALAFLAASRGRAWEAGVLAGLAVATRSMGFALVPALLVLLWPSSRREIGRLVPVVLFPLVALGAFALYLHEHLGDAFAFTHAQALWHRHTSPFGPLSGIKQALSSGLNGASLVVFHLPREMARPAGFDDNVVNAFQNAVLLLILLVAVWLTWVAWRRLGPAYGLYSVATLLIVLSTPREGLPLLSLPRFLLADFPLFLALVSLTQRRPGARTAVLTGFAAVGALAAAGFARSIWIA